MEYFSKRIGLFLSAKEYLNFQVKEGNVMEISSTFTFIFIDKSLPVVVEVLEYVCTHCFQLCSKEFISQMKKNQSHFCPLVPWSGFAFK